MFCRKCGAEINEDSKYCRKCGAELKADHVDQQDKFYISDHGENKGPYSVEELQQLFQENVLKPDSYVWKEDMEKWLVASEVEQLHRIFMQGKKVKCVTCGREYSEKEEYCPYCKKAEEKKQKIQYLKRLMPKAILCVCILSTIIWGGLFYYKNYFLTKEERTAVKETVEAINALGEIDYESEEKLYNAEVLYARLNYKCQRQVKNSSNLREAREEYNALMAQKVMGEIDALGEISTESKEEISNAEISYQSLSESQKRLVENYSVLEEARDRFDQLCAQKVIDKISKIGVVSLDKTLLIKDAWNRYSELSSEQKDLVTNANILIAAEEEITDKLEGLETAEIIVKELMESFDNEMSAEQIFSLVDNSNIFPDAFVELLSRGAISSGIISALSSERIRYGDLNYINRNSMDMIENKIVENLIYRYTMGKPRYVNDYITVDVQIRTPLASLIEKLGNTMADDMESYIYSNKTTIGYMKKYYSDAEFYKYLFDTVITSYSSSWVRQIDMWVYSAEIEDMLWVVKLSENECEWKISSIAVGY